MFFGDIVQAKRLICGLEQEKILNNIYYLFLKDYIYCNMGHIE